MVSVEELLRRDAPLICAERGLWCDGAGPPENSLGSLVAALDAGCEMASFMIRQSREGDLVAFRDPGLQRMTAARGRVSGMATASLTRLPLRAGAGGETGLTSSYLPLLTELLAAAADRLGLVLDIAGEAALDPACRLIARSGLAPQVAVRARPSRPSDIADLAGRIRAHGVTPVLSLAPRAADLPDWLAALAGAGPLLVELRGATPEGVAALTGQCRRGDMALLASTAPLAEGGAFGDAAAETDPDAVWGALIEAGARGIVTQRAAAGLRWRAGKAAA